MTDAPANNTSTTRGLVSVGGLYSVLGVTFITGALRLRWSISVIGEVTTLEIASTFFLGSLAITLAAPHAAEALFVTGSPRRFWRYLGLTAAAGAVLWIAAQAIDRSRPDLLAAWGLNADIVCWIAAPVAMLSVMMIGMALSRMGRNLTRAVLETSTHLFSTVCAAAVAYLVPPDRAWAQHALTWELIGVAGLVPLGLFVAWDYRRLFGRETPLDPAGLRATTWLMRLGRMTYYVFRPLLNRIFLPWGAIEVLVLAQFAQGGVYAASLIKAPLLVFGKRVGHRPGWAIGVAVAAVMTAMLAIYAAIAGMFGPLATRLAPNLALIFVFYIFWNGIETRRTLLLLEGRLAGIGRCTALAAAALLLPIAPAALAEPGVRFTAYLAGAVVSIALAWTANRFADRARGV